MTREYVTAILFGVVAGYCAEFILMITWGSSASTLGIDFLVCATYTTLFIHSQREEDNSGLKRAEKNNG